MIHMGAFEDGSDRIVSRYFSNPAALRGYHLAAAHMSLKKYVCGVKVKKKKVREITG